MNQVAKIQVKPLNSMIQYNGSYSTTREQTLNYCALNAK
ncbi:hypothetical protein PMAG_a0196 [Pseudoalteromonas mariniglutinosa NCIMB 1770]|nr:hypothetical protein [Pseudoalteromonas mariniglutinosa NCIMB 1770]